MDLFYQTLDNHIRSINEKFRAKYVIKKNMYENIILALRDSCGNAQFRHWARKHFKLVPASDRQVVYSREEAARPVVTYEELYTKLEECHDRVCHHGRDKTWKKVQAQYARIPYDVVMIFIRLCHSCSSRQILPKLPRHKPTMSPGYLTRLHVDFIDMTSSPDGPFNWILHVKDHFSWFSWTYPLTSKEVEPVAYKLLNQFYSFGTPRILQTDHEAALVAQVITHMRKAWLGLMILNGRPRFPQTQAAIKRSNRKLQVALDEWMRTSRNAYWSQGLGPVVHAINTSVTMKASSKTPFELVFFSQRTRSDSELWNTVTQSGIENEESLPDNCISEFSELHRCNLIYTETDSSIDTDHSNPCNFADIRDQTLQLAKSHSPARSLSTPQHSHVAADIFYTTLQEIDTAYSASNEIYFDATTIAQDINDMNNNNNNSEYMPRTDDDAVHYAHATTTQDAAEHMSSKTKRQKLHNHTVSQLKYQPGDLVGLYIDCTRAINTTAKILPCKVLSVHLSSTDFFPYRVYAVKGILSAPYAARDLLDLRDFDFTPLHSVDPATLPTITLADASINYVLVGIYALNVSCNCHGKCATRSCPCKAKNIPCRAACHPRNKNACANEQ